MSAATKTSQTAGKVLDVLAALLGHFAHGMTPTDLCKATGLEPSAVTRYVAIRALSLKPRSNCSMHMTTSPACAATSGP